MFAPLKRASVSVSGGARKTVMTTWLKPIHEVSRFECDRQITCSDLINRSTCFIGIRIIASSGALRASLTLHWS